MCLLVCWWIQQRSPNWPQRCNTKVPSTRGKPSKRMFPRSLDQSESSFIAAQIIFKGRNLNIMCEDSNCSFHPLLLWSSHHKHHAHYMYFIWWHKCIQLSEIECVWYPTCQVLFQSPWALIWLAMAGVQPHYNLLVKQRKTAFSCMDNDLSDEDIDWNIHNHWSFPFVVNISGSKHQGLFSMDIGCRLQLVRFPAECE